MTMSKPRKRMSWRQRCTNVKPAHIVNLAKPFAGVPAGTDLLIPSATGVEDYLRSIPAGEIRDIPAMRKALAQAHGAVATCPVTASIILKIVAEAALEDASSGKPVAVIAPFWRVIAETGPIVEKLSCGPDFVRLQREREAQNTGAAGC
ncbi:MAG: hypothetical protein ACRCWF_12610 [Beijerinckiaceae bacterium]